MLALPGDFIVSGATIPEVRSLRYKKTDNQIDPVPRSREIPIVNVSAGQNDPC
jgi:hypothetical protein